jgi:hypothetical protein
MYFPAPGLVLAAGKALTGQPWFGLLTVTALMCAAICWMLQAWLPPGWALIGGAIAIMRIGLFSYWINTYNGGGSVAALGGALVLGAFPRLMRTIRLRDAMLLAIGISILLLSRPFEGLLLCSPVALVLGRWLIFGKNRPTPALAIRRAALPLILIIGAGSWLGYYDYRAFGSPLTLPYTVARATYAVDPYFIWQPQRPVPEYRHQAMRYFYTHSELSDFDAIHTPAGFLVNVSSRLLVAVLFLAGTAFLVPSIMLRRALMDRRIRFLVICCTLMTAGLLIQLFLIPHYLAPYLPALYAIGLQAMRHLRVWAPGKRPVGATLVQLTMTLCIVMAGCRLFAGPLHLALDQWPPAKWLVQWYGPGYFGTKREQMKNLLERLPGKQLVIVRYSPQHNVFDEWVYNDANIDDSNVIWARDMSQADNAALVAFYKDRHPWILDADENPAKLTPFSLPEDAPSIPAHRIQATKLRQQALSFADPGKEPR